MLWQAGQSPVLEPSSGSWTHVRAAGWEMGQPNVNQNPRGSAATISRERLSSYHLLSLILLQSVPWASLPRRQEAVECDKYSSLRYGAESGTRGKEWKSELTDRGYPTKQTNKLRHLVQDSLVCFRNLLIPKWILCTHSFQVYIGAVSRRGSHARPQNKSQQIREIESSIFFWLQW